MQPHVPDMVDQSMPAGCVESKIETVVSGRSAVMIVTVNDEFLIYYFHYF